LLEIENIQGEQNLLKVVGEDDLPEIKSLRDVSTKPCRRGFRNNVED